MTEDQPAAGVHDHIIVPFQVIRGTRDDGQVCDHLSTSFVVDAVGRSVKCKSCGSEVDPYFAIDRFSRCWELWAERSKWAKAVCENHEKRIESLRRKEREAEKRIAALERTERIAADLAGRKPVFGIDKATKEAT